MAIPLSIADAQTCACPRSQQELRRRQEWHGGKARIKHQYQCRTCGRGHGLFARQPLNPDLPLWDHDLPFSDDVELEGDDARTWWTTYREYLNSPEWQDKRQRVFARERTVQSTPEPLCQACWKRAGTTVHHATYRRLRCEPLFDLLICCADCHDYLHSRMGMTD